MPNQDQATPITYYLERFSNPTRRNYRQPAAIFRFRESPFQAERYVPASREWVEDLNAFNHEGDTALEPISLAEAARLAELLTSRAAHPAE